MGRHSAYPQTKHAVITCAGTCHRPTWHRYTHAMISERLLANGKVDVKNSCYELMYRCDKCSEERVWGNLNLDVIPASGLN